MTGHTTKPRSSTREVPYHPEKRGALEHKKPAAQPAGREKHPAQINPTLKIELEKMQNDGENQKKPAPFMSKNPNGKS
jgi:hypothetical protein